MILFDIDGTLIDGSQAHKLAFRHGFARIYDIEPESDRQKYDGQTDSYIIKGKCCDCGLGHRRIEEGFQPMLHEMCRIYKRLLFRYPVELYPGTLPALEMLKEKGHKLGLVTGNLKCIAKAKLESVGLWDFFETGGFGDMSDARVDLVNIAMNNEKSIGFGDTPVDIEAYKAAGVIAIGVASGLTFTREQLSEADHIIDSITPDSVQEVLEKFNY